MEREYKALPTFTKAIEERTVIGIAAVHGNIDDGNDRSWPGSFITSVNGRNRVRFLWQHNSMEPPIAAINYIRELPRSELPQSVLDYAPDATGGVEVSRTYLTDAFADRVLQGIKAGAIAEMSYAYEVTKWDQEEVEGRGQVRNIRQMHIYDLSDVVWGMNPATSADGSKNLPLEVEFADVLAALAASGALAKAFKGRMSGLHTLRAKDGRVISRANWGRLARIRDAIKEQGIDLDDLLDITDPDKASSTSAPEPEKADAAAVAAARHAWERHRSALLRLTGASHGN